MFEYVVVRSDKKDYLVKCSRDECSWTCRASKLARTDMFKIRHIAEGHICASNIVLSTHRQVTKTVVSTCIKYKYTSSRTIYTPNNIRNDVLHTYGVSLNYVKAWQSREKTLKVLRGASIWGWKHCRPVVVIDGTYLNGHYGGTLFTLRKVYGDRDDLCFVSDRHNSIKRAIENVYTGTCHEICSYHLLQNLKSRFGRSGQNITQAFSAAVRAYTLLEYEYYMQQLDSINEKIRGYLDEVGLERWSRFHMSSNWYSTMTSNIVESVNAVTKSAKNYPIIALLESLRQILQSWFCRHKEDVQGTFTTLSSKYEKKMREMSTDMRNLRVSPINQATFSVSGESFSFVVDIENRTCTCRMFQVDQLHCPHVLAVFASMKMDLYEYCSYYYYTRNPAEWIVPNDVHDMVVIALNQKRSCGRPTKKRFRPAYEENIIVKCDRCGESGYNRRTCSNLVPLSQNNKNKERKRTKTGNTH
ncbi:uncharacterized protein LOC111394295 [Olea europaea var. sylvestris]|uniref:uncharacterized protein LOC111394295 n=1 Tax=Olea europaea var. sylvestris TaxID=158386 RepID=UPI000C1D769C|nr:uncharacterized protein LOC111394295 [Olea europaea var. sylvestris]